MLQVKTIALLFILISTVSCAHYRPEVTAAGAALDCANDYLKNCCKTERDIGGW